MRRTAVCVAGLWLAALCVTSAAIGEAPVVRARKRWQFSVDEGHMWRSRPPTVRGGHRLSVTARASIDLPDPGSDRATELLEARDLCAQLLMRLNQKERQLIGMIYADRMTYREVAAVRGLTESAICLKHKALLRKLRRQAEARKLVA